MPAANEKRLNQKVVLILLVHVVYIGGLHGGLLWVSRNNMYIKT